MSNECAKYFGQNNGFGKYKPIAALLLRQTIQMLDEFKIPYFLIAGTLLGYVRHKDFIPWDDDIDLIVDTSILTALPAICEKYKTTLTFLKRGDYLIKTCMKNAVTPYKSTLLDPYLIDKKDKYSWPFVDLFVYTEKETTLSFFEKQWPKASFFPAQKVPFLSFTVSIPSDPTYFIAKNYTPDYMTVYESSKWNHKEEKENLTLLVHNISTNSFNYLYKIT